MELDIEPIKQHSNVRSYAKSAAHELDTRFYPDDYCEYYYAKHLENTLRQPTIGMMALQEAKTKPRLNYPYHFDRNKKIIEEKSNTVNKMKKMLDDTINSLYPKTKEIREFIITHNRIEFDKVKKAKGLNLFEKLSLFFK